MGTRYLSPSCTQSADLLTCQGDTLTHFIYTSSLMAGPVCYIELEWLASSTGLLQDESDCSATACAILDIIAKHGMTPEIRSCTSTLACNQNIRTGISLLQGPRESVAARERRGFETQTSRPRSPSNLNRALQNLFIKMNVMIACCLLASLGAVGARANDRIGSHERRAPRFPAAYKVELL